MHRDPRAVEHGAAGAHDFNRDLAGFGRQEMAGEPDELAANVPYQIGALAGLCRTAGTAVR